MYINDTVSLTASSDPLHIAFPTSVKLRNNGDGNLYLGNTTVTADVSETGGYLIAPGETFEVPHGEDLFLVVDDDLTVTLLYVQG